LGGGNFPAEAAVATTAGGGGGGLVINAPLVNIEGSVNEDNLQQILEVVRDEMRRSLGVVVNQSSRYPVGI
jgi:hypothetical protein